MAEPTEDNMTSKLCEVFEHFERLEIIIYINNDDGDTNNKNNNKNDEDND